MPMKCPLDGSELAPTMYEADVEVDQCPDCKGVWLEEGELERIQDAVENDYSEELKEVPNYVSRAFDMAKAQQEADRTCPKCTTTMTKREYGLASQIMIDVCTKCRGIWLDTNELQTLEVFFERTRSEAKEVRKGFFGSLFSLFGTS